MTQRVLDSLRTAIERVLVMLLDNLTAVATPVRVSLFVGRDRGAVLVAEAARDDGCTTAQSSLTTTDWPLEVNHEPIGSLRFTIPGTAQEPGSAAALVAITTQLEREEPRVMDLVVGLALLGALAAHFHDIAGNRSRRRAA